MLNLLTHWFIKTSNDCTKIAFYLRRFRRRLEFGNELTEMRNQIEILNENEQKRARATNLTTLARESCLQVSLGTIF
jgi:hypothetical protein